MGKTLIKTAFALCCLLLLPQPGSAGRAPKAPGFALPSLSGERVALESFAGQRVFLYFFSIKFPACKNGLIQLNELSGRLSEPLLPEEDQKQNAGNAPQPQQQQPQEEAPPPESKIVCVCVDTSMRDAQQFIAKNNIGLIVLQDNAGVRSRYGVTSFPTSFLLNEGGEIIWKKQGVIDQDDLEKLMLGRSGGEEENKPLSPTDRRRQMKEEREKQLKARFSDN